MSGALRVDRLRAMSTATVIVGVLLVVQGLWETLWPAVLGLALIILGCLLRPLAEDFIRRCLDAKAISDLSDRDLDVLDALLYEGRPALGLTVYEASLSLGYEPSHDEVYASLAALVDTGLIYARQRTAIFYYWQDYEKVRAILEFERERRLRFPKPGSRSRISGLAERAGTFGT